jgi:hypothetical protein
MHDGDHVAELGLKGRVEICAASNCNQAVAVGELGEDSDIAVILELDACVSSKGRELRSRVQREGAGSLRVAMTGGV